MNSFDAKVTPPVADLDSLPFWQACASHRFQVRVCESCGRGHHPPGPICPWCTSRHVDWKQAVGLGKVRSFVTFEHPFVPALADELPYTVLKVALDDYPDVVMHGRLVGPGSAHVGDSVRLVWSDLGDSVAIPNWELADG